MKGKLLKILRVLISVGLLALLIVLLRGKFDEVLGIIMKTNLRFFAASTALYLLIIVPFMALRLKLIFDTSRVGLSFKEVLNLTLIGYFFNNFLPTSIGGDMAKIYYAGKGSDKKFACVGCVLMDRIAGFLGLTLIATLAFMLLGKRVEHRETLWIILAILGGLLAILLLAWNRNLAKGFTPILKIIQFFNLDEKLKPLYDELHHYTHHKHVIMKSIAISIAAQLLVSVAVWLLALSLSCSLNLLDLLLLVPIIGVASMVPSINGLGVREGSFVYFFKSFIGPEKAFAISLLFFAQMLVMSAAGWVVYLTSKQFKGRIIKDA